MSNETLHLEGVRESLRAVEQTASRPQPSEPQSKARRSSPNGGRTSGADLSVSSAPSPSVSFEIDRSTGDLYIQVVDRNTGQVVRQIPPEEFRKLAQNLDEVQGHLFNTLA